MKNLLVTGGAGFIGSNYVRHILGKYDGYRVVVAPRKEVDGQRLPGFADIFRNNTTKNGMLAVELSEPEVEEIFTLVADHDGLTATVELHAQRMVLNLPEPRIFAFDIEAGAKTQLLNGLDDIDLTLQYEPDIRRFESQYNPLNPHS